MEDSYSWEASGRLATQEIPQVSLPCSHEPD
jgi:hypothetical protein